MLFYRLYLLIHSQTRQKRKCTTKHRVHSIILTSLTQNLLLHVGHGHLDPSQVSGVVWSCLEANLIHNILYFLDILEVFIPFSHAVHAPHRPAVAVHTSIFFSSCISSTTCSCCSSLLTRLTSALYLHISSLGHAPDTGLQLICHTGTGVLRVSYH